VVSVALVVSASSLSYVYDKFERLPRVELSGYLDVGEGADDEPENFLIVGIDNAANLDEDDPVRDGRTQSELSDTIMILRIDPATRQAALLSLPRDLWIPIPGTGSSQRINSTLARGGPELLIETIGQDFGIPIHHYVEVDFASFQGLVEAVDGVPVFIPNAIRDRRTGLYVTDLGCVTLDPEQALAYVRSRHFEQLIDGEWELDRSSDLGRIDRQQDFIQRALSRAIDKGARDPRTLDDLIEVALDGITVDDSLTADDIFRLGNRFRSFEPSDLITYSVPVVGDTVGEAQILRLVEDEAEPILSLFRGEGVDGGSPSVTGEDGEGDEGDVAAGEGDGRGDAEGEGTGADAGAGPVGAPELPPSSVTLQVMNGSGATGQASEATRQLAGAGFSVIGTSEMPTFDDDETIVRYPAGQRQEAAVVAAWLASGASLEESSEVGTITVITGVDWDGVRDSARPSTTGTPGGRGEDEGSGDDEGDEGTTATTDEADDEGDESGEGEDDEGSGEGSTVTTAPSLTTSTTAPEDGSSASSSTSSTVDLSARPC
jgi:LCP family protein required for cell wall assembly